MTTTVLKVEGGKITLTYDGEREIGSSVRSAGLHSKKNEAFEAAMDAIESVALAHAIAGIAVWSPAYIEGLNTSIEAICNHLT